MNTPRPSDKEKTLLKVLFWCLAAPMMALMFFRLFFVLFRFVYGSVLILILGTKATNAILFLSVASALGVTIGAIVAACRLLKTHIIN